jgi:type IV pilus assembly protein PilC
MIYPAFVLGMFVIIGTVMMVFVVPKLTAIFKQFGGKLPLPTRILIAVSGFISHWYLELFLAIIVLVILAIYYASTERGKRFLDTMLLTLPVVKGISQKMYLSRFADNLSTLIKGGLPIVQALQVTSDVVGNRVYKSILAEAAEEVRKGNSISSVISKHAEFTPLIVQMVKTGEETGKLDSILLNISDFYKYEVNNSIDGLVALIEPALIVVLGLGVGVLVASILLPIYSLVSNIS